MLVPIYIYIYLNIKKDYSNTVFRRPRFDAQGGGGVGFKGYNGRHFFAAVASSGGAFAEHLRQSQRLPTLANWSWDHSKSSNHQVSNKLLETWWCQGSHLALPDIRFAGPPCQIRGSFRKRAFIHSYSFLLLFLRKPYFEIHILIVFHAFPLILKGKT